MDIESNFYEKMLDSMAIGIFITDHLGKTVFVNQAMLNIVEATKEEFLQSDFEEMHRQGRLKRHITKLVRETKRDIFMPNILYTPGGKPKKLMGVSSPILDEQGNVKYVLSMTLGHIQDLLMNVFMESGGLPEPKGDEKVANLLYESASMRQMVELARRVAKVDTTVLITGESGTGKGVLARYIHNASESRNKELIEVNCAAFPETLLESELFGYEKGSFTGALSSGKPGLMEAAEGGTLFLDEIDSLPLNLQGKLLKVLEEKKVQRVGSLKPKEVHFRLIAATNASLEKLVEAKAFRADLYYRIHVLPLTIPPLRQRPEDIRLLSRYFLEFFCRKYDKIKLFTPSAYRSLMAYQWPGNVRELKNFIERLVIMSDGSALEFGSFPELLLSDGKALPDHLSVMQESDLFNRDFSFQNCVAQYEKELLTFVLSRYGLGKASEILKMDPSTITRKKRKYAID